MLSVVPAKAGTQSCCQRMARFRIRGNNGQQHYLDSCQKTLRDREWRAADSYGILADCRHCYRRYVEPYAMKSSFPGFSPEALKFFVQLKRHNNRPWFLKNKETYEREIKGPMVSLVQ